ncbi:MAG TPA: HAMP domain-containing protein [Dehalococcoidia bacterium]|nr:HAMP domain-containing protein [Dehalococcoidia bacterium]
MLARALGSPFGNLTIRRKLFLIAMVAAVPTAILLFVVLTGQSADLNAAQQERQGAEFITRAQKLLRDVQLHRDQASALLAGDQSFAPQLQASAAAVDGDLKDLAAVDKKYGGRFHTHDDVNGLRRTWDAINVGTPTGSQQDSFTQHTQMITGLKGIIPLIYQVGNASGLLRDPKAASNHIAAALVNNVPQTSEALSEGRAYGAAILAGAAAHTRTLALAGNEHDFLVNEIGQVQSTSDLTTRELDAAVSADPAQRAAFSDKISNADAMTKQFIAVSQNLLLNGTNLDPSIQPYFGPASDAIAATFALSDTSASTLHKLLESRVNQANTVRIFSFAVAASGISLVTLLILFVVLSITGRIARLVAIADRVSLGDLNAEVDIQGNDELGELAQSFERMQSSLQAAIDRLRTRRAS